MSDRFYLYVELAGADQKPDIAQSVRAALAEFVYPDEYNMALEGAKLALEVWTCAQAHQAPLLAAVRDLVRRLVPTEVTTLYLEDDRGSTEQYLGPWRAVLERLAQERQTRQATLEAAYQRQVLSLAHAESRDTFVSTEGWW
jgi:hypothetical protein